MRLLLAPLVTLALLPFLANATQNAGDAPDPLEGVWRVESAHEEGRELKEGIGMVLTFKAGKVTAKVGDQMKEATYKADASKDPKWLDIKTERESFKAIYEIKGDTLRIVHGRGNAEERSTKFVSEQGTVNRTFVVLKREKKS